MRKGWFKIPGVQDGDRTLEEQLKGLGPMLAEVGGATVLDLGCAEGMISLKCLEGGASSVIGFDSNAAFIERARKTSLPHPDFAQFTVKDLNQPPDGPWHSDIVLMLAILHKLRDPLKAVREWGQFASSLIVIRLPASTPGYVKDERSGFVVFDVRGQLEAMGFKLESVTKGHFDEWTGYFRRAK